MFKAGRWRSEKNKIKAVFKLQFRATQVPEIGWEMMMVTLVPMDVGKPTSRSEKAPVIDGECNWGNPIYETVKLSQDPKTGKHNDKVYKFLVSATGSTKSGLLGQITVNLADYARMFKHASVSLPLNASNAGATLHVTLQRMQGDVEERDYDDKNGDVPIIRHRKTLQSQLSNCDNEEGRKVSMGSNDISSMEYESYLHQVQRPDDFNGNLGKSSSLDTTSASGSETSSGQFTPKDNGIKNNTTSQDSASLLSPHENNDTPRKLMTSSSDSVTNIHWSVGSAPNGITGGSTNSSGETGPKERLQESGGSLDKLRGDVVSLKRQLEVSDLEVQTLRKQVVKENRKGQELLKELSGAKEERDSLRREYEELKASQKRRTLYENVPNKSQFNGEDHWSVLEETKQELNHEKKMNETLRLQLQKTQDANSELILAVKDLEELLEQKDSGMSCITCSMVRPDTNRETKETEFRSGLTHLQNPEPKQELFETSSENEEQLALDALIKEPNGIKVACALEQKNIDLNSMVELYKRDREDIEMQMEQLALDYEILKQENHDIASKLEQTKLREQLRMQYDCSAHLAIINDLEAHVECLEKELDEQAKKFEVDLETITNAKVEQEVRAIRAEETLRKIKVNNANIAEHLQEECKTLSVQMSSTFYVNEKALLQALAECNELHSQKLHLEELLQKTNEELVLVKSQCRVTFQQLLSLLDLKTKEADRLFQELRDKNDELEIQKKSEEKRQKASSEEMILLRSEMEKLSTEKNHLAEQIEHEEKMAGEIEEMKILIKEIEMLLQERNMEKSMLHLELASLKEEAEKSAEELNYLKHVLEEKETMIRNQISEGNLFHRRHGTMPEDEKIIKSNSEQLSSARSKKECSGDNNTMNVNTNNATRDGEYSLQTGMGVKASMHDANDVYRELLIRNLEANANKEEGNFASSTCDQYNIGEILSGMALLKERNQSMEAELKDMQERYSNISLKFAEVEGERQQLVITIRTLKNALKN